LFWWGQDENLSSTESPGAIPNSRAQRGWPRRGGAMDGGIILGPQPYKKPATAGFLVPRFQGQGPG